MTTDRGGAGQQLLGAAEAGSDAEALAAAARRPDRGRRGRRSRRRRGLDRRHVRRRRPPAAPTKPTRTGGLHQLAPPRAREAPEQRHPLDPDVDAPRIGRAHSSCWLGARRATARRARPASGEGAQGSAARRRGRGDAAVRGSLGRGSGELMAAPGAGRLRRFAVCWFDDGAHAGDRGPRRREIRRLRRPDPVRRAAAAKRFGVRCRLRRRRGAVGRPDLDAVVIRRSQRPHHQVAELALERASTS